MMDVYFKVYDRVWRIPTAGWEALCRDLANRDSKAFVSYGAENLPPGTFVDVTKWRQEDWEEAACQNGVDLRVGEAN